MAEAKQNLDAYNKSGVKSIIQYTLFGGFALVSEAELNHINPHAKFQLTPNGEIEKMISATPVENARRVVEKIASEFPKGTVLTQTEDVLSVPQIIQNSPLFERINFYLRERTPSQTVSEVNGYSTDIIRWLAARKKRNGDIVLPSQTTMLNGLNAHGENFGKKFAKYLGNLIQTSILVFIKDKMTNLH